MILKFNSLYSLRCYYDNYLILQYHYLVSVDLYCSEKIGPAGPILAAKTVPLANFGPPLKM